MTVPSFVTSMILLVTVALHQNSYARSYKERFSNAQKHYENQKINAAGKELVRLFKEYPKKKEVIELLALVYFERGLFHKTRDLFNRLKPSDISAKSGYAWGASYYSANMWSKAILGFKKVRKKSSYRPLATYFLGVCYFRLDKLESSRKLLRRVRSKDILPVMARNRKKILNNIQLRLKEERQEILEDGGLTLASVSTRGIEMREDDLTENFFQQGNTKKSTQLDKPYKIKPFLKYTQITRNLNNHQFVDESLDVNAYRGGIAGIYKKKNSYEPLNNYGLLASLGYGEVGFESSSSSFFALEQTTGGFVQSETESRNESFLLIDLEPFLTQKLSGSSIYQVSGNIRYNTDPSNSKETWGHYLARGNYQYKFGINQLNLMLSVAQRFDDVISASTQEVTLGAELSKESGQLTYSVTGQVMSRSGTVYREANPFRALLINHPLEPVNGYGNILSFIGVIGYAVGDGEVSSTNTYIQRGQAEQSRSRLRATDFIEIYSGSVLRSELKYNYPLINGTDIFLSGLFEQVGEYHYDHLDQDTQETTNFIANATGQGLNFGATSKPLEWFQLGATLGIIQHTFEPTNFEQSDIFDQKNPDYVSYSQFYMHAFYQF